MEARCGLVVAALATACGRVGFAPGDEPVDAPAASDAASDAAPDAAADAPAGRVIPPGAVLWLRFDDDPTDGLDDSAGAHQVTCTACPSPTPGQFDGALKFQDDLVVVAAADTLLPGTAFTIAAWVRVDVSTGPANVAVACKQAGTDCTYALSVNPSRQPVFYSGGGAGNATAVTQMPLGTWHHLAMTWNGTTKRGYLDGAMVTMDPVGALPSDPAGGLGVGNRLAPTPLPLDGAIDDLVFYNRVLTPAEIVALITP